MSADPKESKQGTDGDGAPGASAPGGVADFLQAPKKKQRNYIIFAAGSNLTPALKDAITKYLTSLSKAFMLVQPRGPEVLARQIYRQIHLLIIDDTFAERSRLLKLVRFMKEKRAGKGLPVMFLTRDPSGLTADYRRDLLVHQESDDFIGLKGIEPAEIVGRIKQAIETRNRRRSRRFKAALPVSWQALGASQWGACELVDISLHGAQLAKAGSDVVFTVKSQLRLQIPVAGQANAADGEILRLSARVRRVSVDGGAAGVSFEHLTDRHVLALTELITNLAATEVTSSAIDNSTSRPLE